MTTFVGIILLLVFLAFATLMFLERLSALLALPLMAVSFLFVAAVADMFQPAMVTNIETRRSVDAFGRQQAEVRRVQGPSRYSRWSEQRRLLQQLQHDKAALFGATAQRLSAVFASNPTDTAAFRALLAAAHADVDRFMAEAGDRLAQFPDFFGQPPFHRGAAARALQALDEVDIASHIRGLANILDRVPPDQQADQLAGALIRMERAAARATAAHGDVPAADAGAFRVMTAVTYVGEYFISMFRAGALKLAAAIIATIFGGMFAVYVKNLKVAEKLVYWTAEFAGEQPFIITLAVFVVTAIIFTSVGGLGTVIMLGTIILPILRSIGLSPIVGTGVFLIAIAMGGTLHPAARALWLSFYGLTPSELNPILWTMVALYGLAGVAWIVWGTQRTLLSSFQTEAVTPAKRHDEVSTPLMLAPLLPVVLVYFGGIEEITAFTVAIAYMFLCVLGRRGAVRVLARSLIEGAQTVMPPVLLMLGIGMLLVSLTTDAVQGYLTPLLSGVVPTTQVGYILTFAVAAPLALYRGPLNVWGMGLAVSAILLATSGLPPAAVLGAILAAGMLQGVCDPTNTANVWIAGFQGITVNQILRYTILPIWAAAMVAVVIFGVWLVG